MTVGPPSTASTSTKRVAKPPTVVRVTASAVVLIVVALLTPVALVASWARVQLVDEDSFVATLAPLSSDPAVQDLVIAETTSAISASVDFSAIASAGVDGLVALGVPQEAARVLGLLAQPSADSLRSITQRAVTDVVHSDRFSDVWSGVVRTAHRAFVFGATSDGGGIIVQTPDGVGVQIGGVVSAIVAELDLQGSPVAALVPPIDRVVVLGDGTTLQAVRSAYAAATTAGVAAPLLVGVLLVGGVVVAPRRRRALIGAGIAVAVGSAAVLVAVAVGAAQAHRTAVLRGFDAAGIDAVVRQLSSGLVGTASTVLGIGLVAGIAGVLLVRRARPRRMSEPRPTLE